MPSVDYTVAQVHSFCAGGLFAVCALVAFAFGRTVRESGTIAWKLYRCGFLIVVSAACGFAVQLLTYSVANTSLNIVVLGFGTFIQNERADILSLRIVSVIVAIQTLETTFRYLLAVDYVKNVEVIRSKTTGYQFLDQMPEREPRTILAIFFLSQATLYCIAAFALWHAVQLSLSDWIAKILSFSLLFIVDDWSIIRDYVTATGGRILNIHRLRLFAINSVLVSGVATMAMLDFSGAYSLMLTIGAVSAWLLTTVDIMRMGPVKGEPIEMDHAQRMNPDFSVSNIRRDDSAV